MRRRPSAINADNAITAGYFGAMVSHTIRNLEDNLKARLRVQAAVNGHSMEEEARTILRGALNRDAPAHANLYDAIRARFVDSGGGELEPMPREPIRDPPAFE
jgi:plasmid stability protein